MFECTLQMLSGSGAGGSVTVHVTRTPTVVTVAVDERPFAASRRQEAPGVPLVEDLLFPVCLFLLGRGF